MSDLTEQIDPHNHILNELRLLKADLHRAQQQDNGGLGKSLSRLDKLEAYLVARADSNVVPLKIGYVSVTKYGTAGSTYASVIVDNEVKSILERMENKTSVYVLMPMGHRKMVGTLDAAVAPMAEKSTA